VLISNNKKLKECIYLKKNIIKLSRHTADFTDTADELDAEVYELTQPTQPIKLNSHHHNFYEDKYLGLTIGVLDTSDTTETTANYSCDYDEFMVVIEGIVEITNNKTGTIQRFIAGESAVIPQGYDYHWHYQSGLSKFYLLCEPQEKRENPIIDNVVCIDDKSDIPWQVTSDGHRKKILYHNNNHRFSAGVWQSNGLTTELIDFPYNEFIFINEGSLICTDEIGLAHHFKRGDALFIPQGTRCAWKIKGKISIHFTQIK
jgi:uncharacterized cupin superfamily protein